MQKSIKLAIIITYSSLILGLLITSIFSIINENLLLFLQKIFPHKLLLLLSIVIIVILLTVLLINKLSRSTIKSPNLKLIYSIFGDKIGNPYCPICKTPLSVKTNYILKCNKCNTNFTPTNSFGASVSILGVKNNLKQLWK